MMITDLYPQRCHNQPSTGLRVQVLKNHMGGCRNYGPFLGTLNSRCRTIIGTQKGTIILTTTHIHPKTCTIIAITQNPST